MNIVSNLCCNKIFFYRAVIKALHFSTLSVHNSKKFLFVKIRSFLPLNSFSFKRELMDLTSVLQVFEEKVPPHLSEKWDNTGLLIEPSTKSTVFSFSMKSFYLQFTTFEHIEDEKKF